MEITNRVVANAIAASAVAKNAVEVEISPGYAARAQYAMKDAARGVSGVRISGTNTLSCPDDDAAEDVIEIIKMAGVPASEVWTNSRRVAKNGESEQKEIVEMNIDSLKKDLDKVVRGLDETKRWMGKYGDNRIASIDKAKGAVVQAIQQLKY